jgi:hypothetical protein
MEAIPNGGSRRQGERVRSRAAQSKKWDEGHWFMELTEPICARAGIDTGDRIVLGLQHCLRQIAGGVKKLIVNSCNGQERVDLSYAQRAAARTYG